MQITIYIDNQVVDLYPNIEDQLRISSIKEIRAQTFSSKFGEKAKPSLGTISISTLKLPGTQNNCKIFNSSQNPDMIDNSGFYDLRIVANGILSFSGKCIRKETKRVREGVDYIRIDAWSDNVDWVDSRITLIDIAPESYTWTKEEIDNNINLTQSTPLSTAGVEWCYPDIQRRDQNNLFFYYPDKLPALTWKSLVDKYFLQKGYLIDCEILNKPEIGGSLCIPFCWGRFGNSEEWYERNTDVLTSVDTSDTMVFSNTLGGLTARTIPFNNEITDEGDNYTPPSAFIAPIRGVYNFVISNFVFTNFTIEQQEEFSIELYIVTSSASAEVGNQIYTNIADGELLSPDFEGIILLEAGQAAIPFIRVNFPDKEQTFSCDIKAGFFSIKHNRQYVVGNEVQWTEFLPKIPFIELWNDFMIMFHLYPETDKLNKIITFRSRHGFTMNNVGLGDTDFEPFFKADEDLLDYKEKFAFNNTYFVKDRKDVPQEFRLEYAKDAKDGYQQKIVKKNGINSLYGGNYLFPETYPEGFRTRSTKHFTARVHLYNGIVNIISMVKQGSQKVEDFYDAVKFDFKPSLVFYAGNVFGNVYFDGKIKSAHQKSYQIDYTDPFAPSLAFDDQTIEGTVVNGLMFKAYFQHLACLRHGKELDLWLRLTNSDVAHLSHRTLYNIDNVKCMLLRMDAFRPAIPLTTKCALQVWRYGEQEDLDAFTNTNIKGIADLPSYTIKTIKVSANCDDDFICFDITKENNPFWTHANNVSGSPQPVLNQDSVEILVLPTNGTIYLDSRIDDAGTPDDGDDETTEDTDDDFEVTQICYIPNNSLYDGHDSFMYSVETITGIKGLVNVVIEGESCFCSIEFDIVEVNCFNSFTFTFRLNGTAVNLVTNQVRMLWNGAFAGFFDKDVLLSGSLAFNRPTAFSGTFTVKLDDPHNPSCFGESTINVPDCTCSIGLSLNSIECIGEDLARITLNVTYNNTSGILVWAVLSAAHSYTGDTQAASPTYVIDNWAMPPDQDDQITVIVYDQANTTCNSQLIIDIPQC